MLMNVAKLLVNLYLGKHWKLRIKWKIQPILEPNARSTVSVKYLASYPAQLLFLCQIVGEESTSSKSQMNYKLNYNNPTDM
jgi:hypothetical protein